MTQATQTIPAGYKQTEIGVIPEDWVMERLGQLINYKNGKSFEKFIVENGKYKLITLNSLDINGKLKKEHLQVNIYDSSLNKDDLIMILSDVAHGNFLGLTDLVPENDKYVLNQRVGALKNVKKVKPYLLSKYINYHQKYFKTAGQGSSQLNLSKGDIVNFIVSFPSNPKEQTAIATALSDTDALIEKLEKLITKKKAIKQGAMQQLLTGKKRLPGFSGKWEVKKLGEIFRVTRGQVLSTRKMKDSRTPDYRYPVYSSQTLNNGLTGYFNNFLFENAITWTTDGANAGDVKYRNGKFYCTNVCGVLLSDQGYANWCIAEIFGMISKKYVSYVGNPKLMNNVVKNIPVLIPLDVKEQTAIATVLSDMDAEIEKLENKLNKYHQIKTGVMQQLLTGKIRLLKK